MSSTIHASSINAGSYNLGFDLGTASTSIKYPIKVSNEVSITYGLKGNNTYGSFFIGYRWHNDIGAQLGYTYMQKITYISIGSSAVTQTGGNTYLDAIYYKRITSGLEFKALGGVGVLSTKLACNFYGLGYNINAVKTSTGVSMRIGAGLQYDFSRNLSMDLMLKYQPSGNSIIQGVTWLSIGMMSYI